MKISSIFDQLHPPQPNIKKGTVFECEGSKELGAHLHTYLNENLTVSHLSQLNIKSLKFKCRIPDLKQLEALIENTTKETVNSFEILMRGKQVYPDKIPMGKMMNEKQKLYNTIVDEFKEKELSFSTNSNEDPKSTVQILCNALWAITSHHDTINEASTRRADVRPIPALFEKYKNLNSFKKKKKGKPQLTSIEIEGHADALYSLLMKPVTSSSQPWRQFSEELKALAQCLSEYKKYLDQQSAKMRDIRDNLVPCRSVSQDAVVEIRERNPRKSDVIKGPYELIDKKVCKAEFEEPVMLDEETDLKEEFTSRYQRYMFLAKLQLSCPVLILRYCPGGTLVTTVILCKIQPGISEAQKIVLGSRLLVKHKSLFEEYHTRAQRKLFRRQLNNITAVKPMIANFIYTELTLDATTAQNPEIQEKLKLVFLGNIDIVPDMRIYNQKKSSFDPFFQKMNEIVLENSAADERRHNIAHMSKFLSVSDLVKQTKERCDEDTPIPSESTVRLQFAPKNPYTARALSFTSRVEVQFKIQSRQLRAEHMDTHYCNAQFKYMKERAMELGDKCTFICADDKAKVPVGEPGSAVSTGVRGRQSIVPVNTTIASLDHDMTKASITPSVMFEVAVPKSPSMKESFYTGLVHVFINDSVFEVSSPFRHGSGLVKILQEKPLKPVLLKFTDGGVDQRNTLESVKIASICLFKELNLDMLILARCAPGQSWMNPAERQMALLNIGLQNVALSRERSQDEDIERQFAQANSMSELRKKCSESKAQWSESIQNVKDVLQERFKRLSLKGELFDVREAVSGDDIDIFKRHGKELFPGLDMEKLQKKYTEKNQHYKSYVEKHCRSRHYTFQIRKCSDRSCCLEPTLKEEDLKWLPDPELSTEDHYRKYQDAGQETTEKDRPSLNNRPSRQRRNAEQNSVAEETGEGENAGTGGEAGPGGNEGDQVRPDAAATAVNAPVPTDTAGQPAAEATGEGENAGTGGDMAATAVNAPVPMDTAGQPAVVGADEGNVITESDNEANLVTPGQDSKEDVARLFPRNPHGTKLYTAQHARTTMSCVECRKPRVIYMYYKPTSKDMLDLVCYLSDYELFTCGSPILPHNNRLFRKAFVRELSCLSPIELPYYTASLGRLDICCHCCTDNTFACQEMKKRFKSVLPVCDSCCQSGKEIIARQPYGRKRKSDMNEC